MKSFSDNFFFILQFHLTNKGKPRRNVHRAIEKRKNTHSPAIYLVSKNDDKKFNINHTNEPANEKHVKTVGFRTCMHRSAKNLKTDPDRFTRPRNHSCFPLPGNRRPPPDKSRNYRIYDAAPNEFPARTLSYSRRVPLNEKREDVRSCICVSPVNRSKPLL